MMLAIIADALQIVVFPLFVEGALSPADDMLDFGIAGVLVHLLGWHWEFLPSFLAKLVPGVDLVPFWTMAVANVYRKSKRIAVNAEESRDESGETCFASSGSGTAIAPRHLSADAVQALLDHRRCSGTGGSFGNVGIPFFRDK
jgi:hypothetical protein